MLKFWMTFPPPEVPAPVVAEPRPGYEETLVPVNAVHQIRARARERGLQVPPEPAHEIVRFTLPVPHTVAKTFDDVFADLVRTSATGRRYRGHF